jgi:hypothetical protein
LGTFEKNAIGRTLTSGYLMQAPSSRVLPWINITVTQSCLSKQLHMEEFLQQGARFACAVFAWPFLQWPEKQLSVTQVTEQSGLV